MHATPTASNHHVVATANANPTSAATPKAINAARLTACGVAMPDATSRTGPTRAVSVPLTPSL